MEVRHAHKQTMNVICFISDLDDTFAKVSWFIVCFLKERQARDTGARECFFVSTTRSSNMAGEVPGIFLP